jgi:hypothetical protein
MAYLAGPYSVSIDSNTIGDTDGVYLGVTPSHETIDNTDSGGRSPVDAIFRGGSCYLTLTLLSNVLDPATWISSLWPVSATLGNVGVPGILASDFAVPIVLTSITGATPTPATITLAACVPAPGFPIRLTLAPALRRTTLRFLCLPSTGNWFTTGSGTTPSVSPSGYLAGKYGVSYGTAAAEVAMGDTELGSVQFEWNFLMEEIRGDSGGDVIQDCVYQGVNCYTNMVMLEYTNAAVQAALWPYGTFGSAGQAVLGKTMSTYQKSLLLTALADTPAEASPATIQMPNSILAPGNEINFRMGVHLRKLPLRFQHFISADGTMFNMT